jgi:hypothetical protein
MLLVQIGDEQTTMTTSMTVTPSLAFDRFCAA